MKPRSLHHLLDRVVAARGSEEVSKALHELLVSARGDSGALTIVANAGLHVIPDRYLRGEVFMASTGNWDDSSEQALTTQLETILERVAAKLRSHAWTRVYLVPTGHPILSLQIKAMVYRLLRVNSIDLYHKQGRYFELDIDQRALALRREASELKPSRVQQKPARAARK